MEKYQYSVKKTIDMSDEEFQKCANLFSTSYGKYTKDSPFHPGQQIKMKDSFFLQRYKKEGVYIAQCKNRSNGSLVGQAIYARKKYKELGTMTWVMQLVVSDRHRKEGIGSTLLHSIWGFSDDFAWGLATANPCTVKALERATFRKCDPKVISSNIDIVKKFEKDIQFVENIEYEVNESVSQVNTHFYIDNSEFASYENDESWKLGELKKGHEWLAFTFREQKFDEGLLNKHFHKMMGFSDDKLKDAYGRMRMTRQKWAQYERQELEQIQAIIPFSAHDKILDVGCGTGRHTIELAKRNCQVVGIDFSSKNIKYAKAKAKNNYLKCDFFTLDARDLQKRNYQMDKVLCLYDVIGSFPEKKDNQQILQGIWYSLKSGGYAVISVMNLDYLTSRIKEISEFSVKGNMQFLYALKPSKIMQKTGEIFDDKYLLLDKESGVVYRKEQFEEDEYLPAEYLIRDKRYRKEEIEELAEECGFCVVESRYVRAGDFSRGQKSEDCKEILLILRKRDR